MAGMLVGTRVRQLRRERAIKQLDLAQSVKISASYLNLIEHNRRPVAGGLLVRLAEQLGVEVSYLTQDADTKMLERFHQTARRTAQAGAELDRIADFISRFPGWAALLDREIQQNEAKTQTLETLSDQFQHDPVLRDTLHIMLTNITAIRSTAEILVLHGSLEQAQRARFDANIFQESKRLARKAEELLAAFDPDIHIDPSAPAAPAPVNKEAEGGVPVGRFVPELEPELEPDSDSGSQRLASPIEEVVESLFADLLSANPHLRAQLMAWATRYYEAARAFPLEALISTASTHHYDPFILAELSGGDVPLAFFRLAHLPDDREDMPRFGLLEIDNSAGVWLRKEISGFRLPNRSGACPRWPIYRALSQPGQGYIARLSPIDGLPCLSYNYAWQMRGHGVGLPPLMHAMMLYREISPADKLDQTRNLQVGFHCAICARTDCSDRRDAYALTA